jgi:hypothetical protein
MDQGELKIMSEKYTLKALCESLAKTSAAHWNYVLLEDLTYLPEDPWILRKGHSPSSCGSVEGLNYFSCFLKSLSYHVMRWVV